MEFFTEFLKAVRQILEKFSVKYLEEFPMEFLDEVPKKSVEKFSIESPEKKKCWINSPKNTISNF